MIAIDIGNSNISLGIFQDNILLKTIFIDNQEFDINSANNEFEIDLFAQKYYPIFLNKLKDNNIDFTKINKIVILSVVDYLSLFIKILINKYLSKDVLFIGKDIFFDIKNKTIKKQEVGQDRIANSYYGYHKYKKDLLIIDFGTATTFDILSNNYEYLGGVIAPGLNLSAKSLHNYTDKLPLIKIDKIDNIIGNDTISAINSGIYFGHIFMIKGMIENIIKEAKIIYDIQIQKVIATGGMVNLFKDIKSIDIIDKYLTLKSINLLYKKSGY